MPGGAYNVTLVRQVKEPGPGSPEEGPAGGRPPSRRPPRPRSSRPMGPPPITPWRCMHDQLTTVPHRTWLGITSQRPSLASSKKSSSSRREITEI